jgi:hypothetical protein
MATTAEAIEAIATATGIQRVTVERAAVILRTAPGDLWPTGGRGGGIKAARPKVSHFVNLGLAIVAADPLNEAPELVRRYRDLVPAPPNHLWMLGALGPDPEVWARSEKLVSEILDWLCPGPTLGDMLDGLVRHLMSAEQQPLARAERRTFAREHLRAFTVWRHRFRGGAIGARLETSAGSRSFREPVGGLLPLMEEGLEDQGIPVAAALDSTSIPCRIFEIMADLALTGERGHDHKPSSDVASGTAAEDTETTTPATGETGPAPVETASQPGGNPVNPAERDSQQDRSTREREQSSSPAVPPGSPSSGPTDQTEGGHHGHAEDFRHAAPSEHRVQR